LIFCHVNKSKFITYDKVCSKKKKTYDKVWGIKIYCCYCIT